MSDVIKMQATLLGTAVKGPSGEPVGFISDVETSADGVRYGMTITDEATKALLSRPLDVSFSDRHDLGYELRRTISTHLTGLLHDALCDVERRLVPPPFVFSFAEGEPLVHRAEPVVELYGCRVQAHPAVRRGWVHVIDATGAHHPFELKAPRPPGFAALADPDGEGGVSITGDPVSAATSGPEREKKSQKNGESRIGGPEKPAPDDRRIDDQRHVERDRKDTSDGR
ncbi:MAG: hypothetical protein ITG02_01135 [Patulibacter sp.]|nr:hypothetical protein [Patulibacter sp.]